MSEAHDASGDARQGNPLSRLLVDHPRIILAAFLIVALAIGSQARHFEVDASAETLLTRDNEHYINTQLANRRFSPDEFLLLAYSPTAHALFSEQSYADVRAISEQLMELERASSVQSILNVPLLSGEIGRIDPNTDFDSLTLEQQDYSDAELAAIFDGHPLFEDLLINAEQTAMAIQLSFEEDAELRRLNEQLIDLQAAALEGELSEDQEAQMEFLRGQIEPLQEALDAQRNEEIAYVREVISDYEDRADIYLGGAHVLGFQLIQIIQNDLILFGSAIGLMICLVLFAVFRRVRWVLIPVVCCAVSVAATMGLLAMLGLKATVISANFIALQLILTLALVIHLIVQYREYGRDRPEADRRSLVLATLHEKAAPILYAGLTTSVGFSSLLLSGIQPVISFGTMMIIAMAISIVTSLILFPAMMALFSRESSFNRNRLTSGLVGALSSLALGRPLLTGLGSVLILAALAVGISRLNVENSFINYFDDDTQVHRELTFIDQEFGGSTPLDIIYRYQREPGEEDLVLDAETVQTMQVVQENLRDRLGMGKVLSVVNFTEVARDMNNGEPLTEYELASLYLLMEEPLREDLLGSFIDTEDQVLRISARIADTTEGLNRGDLIEDLRADLQEILPVEAEVQLTSLFVLYQDILEKLFRSQILTLGLVFLVLSVAFAAIFRSIRIALVALLPNVLATLAMLGVMGWTGIPLDLMTITIAAIAMGIAVDDTIHYVHRFKEEIGRDTRGEDAQERGAEAVRSTHDSVGYAIVYTSVIVTLGFSLLSFSDFVPSVYFGLLTGLAMILAMFSNLTLLPVMLRRVAT